MRAIALVALSAAVLLPGCATKKFVNRQVGEVNQKVEGLSADRWMTMLGYVNPPGFASVGVVNTAPWRQAA